MTPSIVAAVFLFACPPAWPAPPDYQSLITQARPLYTSHKDKDPKTLDQALKLPLPPAGDAAAAKAFTDAQALFMAARDVQEGCVRPCSSESEIAIYREKARQVGWKLGFSESGLEPIEKNYIPLGACPSNPL